MSDYLSNLAAKALRRTNVIQPRLTSLFEPSSVTDGPLAGRLPTHVATAPEEPLADDTAWAVPLMATAPFSNLAPAPSSRPGMQQLPAMQPPQPGTGADQAMAAPAGPPASRQPSSPSVPPPVNMRSEPLPRPAMPTPVQTTFTLAPAPGGPSEAGRPTQAPPRQRPRPDPQELVSDMLGPQADAALSGQTAAPDNQAALAPPIRPRPEEQGSVPTTSPDHNIGYLERVSHRARGPVLPATVVAQQHDLPLLEPAVPTPTARTMTQEPGPTIKITIGRVDVRAIMPVAPASRPTPARPSPALSLEDYLKRREGRRP